MGESLEVDIQRILAITWKAESSNPKTIDEIARFWSLNLQWLNPEEALLAANNFVTNGWLNSLGNGYVPSINIQGVIAPLGWWPKTSLFMGDYRKDPGKADVTNEIKTTSTNSAPATSENEISSDNDKILKRMIRFVASKSGLEREEVERRAGRKVAALGHITDRMSVILVAKEQGLDVSDLLVVDGRT